MTPVLAPQHRRFPAPLQELAKLWAQQAVTSEQWMYRQACQPSTESQPFIAERSDGMRGVGKPGVPKAPEDSHAAHEKIASDLAFLLGLPVPPVILWVRSGAPNPFCCISAWAFPSCVSWAQAEAALSEADRSAAAAIFSAMETFERWISCDDRKAEHVLVSSDRGAGLALAFIDYSFSMSKYWPASAESPTPPNAPYYPVGVLRDKSAVSWMAEQIRMLDTSVIEGVVRRIPDNYLNSLKKEMICITLSRRAERIDALTSA